jgi:hypothetical protein
MGAQKALGQETSVQVGEAADHLIVAARSADAPYLLVFRRTIGVINSCLNNCKLKTYIHHMYASSWCSIAWQ